MGAKRKLAAILAADVVGYSRLMGDDDEATLAALKESREIFRRCIADHGGRIVNAPGDAVLAEFPSAVEAVRAGVTIQKALGAHNEDVPEPRKMRYRIGVNLGDVIEEDDGSLYGDGVNIAARLEGLAEAGGITVSESVFHEVEGRADLSFAFIGNHRVKNIRKPVPVYRLGRTGLPFSHRLATAFRRARVPLAAVGLALVFVLGGWWWWSQTGPGPANQTQAALLPLGGPLEVPEQPSVAVLPFTNHGQDGEYDYLADGLSESLITTLSQIPSLFVISRNSSFIYKGQAKDVRAIAEELGVRHVLEGSVQVSDDQVRITATLIDAATGSAVWSAKYDRTMDDLFALQDEISLKVVEALQIRLTDGEQASLDVGGTDNIEAWTLFQQAFGPFYEFTPSGIKSARDLFQKAADVDPQFARAWVLVGWTHWIDAQSGHVENREAAIEAAEAVVEKALKIAPESPEAVALLGGIQLQKRNYETAVALARRATALSPNNASVKAINALILLNAGYPEDAIELIHEAMRVSPFYPIWFLNVLADAYRAIERYDGVVLAAETALDRAQGETAFPAIYNLIAAYQALGRKDDARAMIDELLAVYPDFTVEGWAACLKTTALTKDWTVVERLLQQLRDAGVPTVAPGESQTTVCAFTPG